MNAISICSTTPDDFAQIAEVHERSFGYDKEARLTMAMLRDQTAEPIVSLLALCDGKAVGHILFTRCTFEGESDQPMMHILAPLAVVPEVQRTGIGAMLIRDGIDRVKALGSKLVFVLGHRDYYPRHGFVPRAEALGFVAPYPIPAVNADCWMVQVLSDEAVKPGRVVCCNELNRPEHWRDEEADR